MLDCCDWSFIDTVIVHLCLNSLWLSVLLQQPHEALLLLIVLESAMSKFGRSVDELQCDLLQSFPTCLSQQTLPQSEHSLLGSWYTALQHHEVFIHLSVMRETTHWREGLLSNIIFSRCIILDHFVIFSVDSPTNTVHFLVSIYTVMVTTLTSTRHREANTSWMPCSNTSNLSETFVGFPRQLLRSPSEGHTSESLSFGHTNYINHLVLTKHGAYRYRFLQMFLSPINFVSNRATIDLQFHDMCFLLFQSDKFLLSVNQNSDNFAVLLDFLQIPFNTLLSIFISPLLGGLSESLSF